MPQSSNSLTAASSIESPSSDAITTTAISTPDVRSTSPIVALSRPIVSARSIPGMSVTQVPSRVRGLGMLVSGSAPAAAMASETITPRASKTQARLRT
jgi:hypothetical protein